MRDTPSSVEHGYSVAYRPNDVHVVFDDDDGRPVLSHLVDSIQNPVGQRRIDTCGPYISKDTFRFKDQYMGKFEELLLSPAAVARFVVGNVVDFEDLQHPLGASSIRCRDSEPLRVDGEKVFRDRAILERSRQLKRPNESQFRIDPVVGEDSTEERRQPMKFN